MKLAKIKEKLIGASLRGDKDAEASLTQKMFRKIFKRKEEGKKFKSKHIL